MATTTSFVRAPSARPFAPAAAAIQLQRGGAAAQPLSAPQQQQRRHPVAAAAEAREVETIENLNTQYCDEFECTSSPAVEATVRATARALGRCSAGPSRGFLSRNVEYRDSFRRFKGPEGYQSLTFVQDVVGSPRVQVTRMRMIDNANALIDWRLTGSIGALPLAVEGETLLSLNVLTGQIDKHTESWDLSKCLLPSRLAWNLTRAGWSAKRATADAAASADRVLTSLTSVDEEDGPQGGYQANPNDPMKFFQPGQDDFKQDALLFTGVVALLYFMVQAWTSLAKM